MEGQHDVHRLVGEHTGEPEGVGRRMPHLVTAVIKPFKLDEVKEALKAAGILGLTTTEVQGYGRQGGKTETFRGAEYQVEFIPKVKIEVIVSNDDLDAAFDAIATTAQTGKIGDGKVWSIDLDRLQRIRTGDVGDDAA